MLKLIDSKICVSVRKSEFHNFKSVELLDLSGPWKINNITSNFINNTFTVELVDINSIFDDENENILFCKAESSTLENALRLCANKIAKQEFDIIRKTM